MPAAPETVCMHLHFQFDLETSSFDLEPRTNLEKHFYAHYYMHIWFSHALFQPLTENKKAVRQSVKRGVI
jgi:hypothetical protein